ncbi:MAG: hypothetical protein JWO74_4733 [Solirubrobacterales bacterium]|jgi:GAF domain-containing protein|nr:hypothetical protein [Solirubrobacterales bacterium]
MSMLGLVAISVPTLRSVEHTVQRLLASAREMLDLDLAYVSVLTDDVQLFVAVDGDAASFGVQRRASIPLEASYCRLMLDGEIPNAILDAAGHEILGRMPITAAARVGSWVGVPIELADGTRYGSLCCASHRVTGVGAGDVRLLRLLARFIADALEQQLGAAKSADQRAEAQGLHALLAMLSARDGYTGEHSLAVVDLAVACARRIGLSESEIDDIRQVALLHDIGKVGIPDAILGKPGPLSADEWEVMREHPVIASGILQSMPALAHLAPAVRAEHERFDGSGYPDGLSGTEIPMGSRIVLAVDAYQAMTSDRPYRPGLPPETARHELFRGSGMQFCPTVVRALLPLLAGPAGAPEPDRPVRFDSPARAAPSMAAPCCEQATAFALVA